MSDPKKAATESDEQSPNMEAWEKSHQSFLQNVRHSGIAVTETEPFAPDELTVTFPQGRRPAEKPVTVSVEWGYEDHSIEIPASVWRGILAGVPEDLESTGWYEGTEFEIRWSFDKSRKYSLVVSYGDDGADGFIGAIEDATIAKQD